MNKFDQMRAAMAEAHQVQRAADQHAGEMARILKGRLRRVSPAVLADLKRELQQFNAHTGRWKS